MKVANRIANSSRHRIRLSVFAMMMGGSLALAPMSLPVSAHSRIPTTTTIRLQRRTVAAHGQKSLIPFRPQSLQKSTAGVPGGWGQVDWPTATVAWAWIQPHMSGGFLKHTTNGGKTWDFWYTPRIAWSQVAAIGAQSVSLLGERLPKPQALHPHAPLIWLHTTNGGGVWTRWVLTNPPLGHSIRTTAIFPRTGFQALGVSQDGYLWWTRTGTRWHTLWPSSDQVLTVAPIPGSGEAVAVKTSAHTTWIGTVTIPSRGPIVSGAWHPAPAVVQGMDWLNRQDGWMWSSTRIWRSTNGGATWTALGAWPGTRWAGGQIIMTTAQTGFAAVEPTNGAPPWNYTQLWDTQTAGRTWTQSRLPVIDYHLPAWTGTLVGFEVTAVRPPNGLTLWYGPVTAGPGTPQRIWTHNLGRTWHLAQYNAVEPGGR